MKSKIIMHKILLTGSTSVGKTTLLETIKNSKLPIACIPEIAREILENDPDIEKSPFLQDIIFSEQMKREKEAMANGSPYILCDRGSLDIIAFSNLFNIAIKKEWIEWTKTYDRIFLLDPLDINFQLTPLQMQLSERNWVEHRMEIHHQIVATLNELNFPYSLLSGSIDTRSEVIKSLLWEQQKSVEGTYLKGKEKK